MKPRYRITIMDASLDSTFIEKWIATHWGYEYWDDRWYCGWDFLLNYEQDF